MPTTFNVISLGTAPDMDLVEGDNVADNAAALVGLTFGSFASPLYQNFVSFSPGTGGFDGGTAGYYDQDNAPAENFRIDGGPDQVFDSAARYLATLTYTDGTTASVNVAIFQDTAGNTYLAPETSQNATQDALEAKPIRSLTLDSLFADTTSGLVADRDAFEFVTCFTPGTRLTTPSGQALVETLRQGDLVTTLDHGPQPIRWIGGCDRAATGSFAPVRICAGALGPGLPRQDILVSQQHRIVIASRIAERVCGASSVLVPAKKLLGVDGITLVKDVARVRYLHILFDRHEIVLANGAPTESLLTGPMATDLLGTLAILQIELRFPGITRRTGTPARRIPRGNELRRLLSRHRKNAQPLVRADALAPAPRGTDGIPTKYRRDTDKPKSLV